MANKVVEQTGFFISGCDSRNDPAYIAQNAYPWGFNGLNRGGIYRTRPGYCEVIEPPVTGELMDANNPQGMIIFKPLNSVTHKVVAHGGKIYKSRYPFETFEQIPGLSFYPFSQIIFEVAIKSTITNADGSLTFVPKPYPVLMIQDGFSRAGFWDGSTARHTGSSPSKRETPTGQTMRWSGQRLWVGDGHKLHASNEGDPIGFTEAAVTATGGFFVLPGDITAIGQTPDLRALLVFTDDTTTSFQSAILDRNAWRSVPDFQKLLFINIGCVGPKAVVNQYGMTWWMSHNGIVRLDNALQTYRTSRIQYSDHAMSRSKTRLHKNLRGVCAGQFENFIFFSVPSGDRHNAHTWVADQTSYEAINANEPLSWAGVWKGVRPVEWVTAVIDGVNRCFCLSRDYASYLGNYRIGIWEAFCPQRADVQLDGTVKRIKCGFESRQLAFTADPKKISAVEWDLSEIKGRVNLSMFFCGRRSGYTEIGTKQIIASEGSLGGPLQQEIDTDTIIGSYLPQQRVIRSQEIRVGNALATSAQSKYIQSIDRAFGTYIEWEGEMAVNSVRIFCEHEPEKQIGRCEPDETTARIVDWDGKEQVLDTAPVPPVAHPKSASFVDSITQRFKEPFYSSR